MLKPSGCTLHVNIITLPNQNKPRPPENLIWDAGGSVLNVLPEERGMERNSSTFDGSILLRRFKTPHATAGSKTN